MGKEPENNEKAEWRVVRQDLHGNRYFMTGWVSEQFAKEKAEEYNAKGHKQTYWAEKKNPHPDPLP
jgi:hypothetical protein